MPWDLPQDGRRRRQSGIRNICHHRCATYALYIRCYRLVKWGRVGYFKPQQRQTFFCKNYANAQTLWILIHVRQSAKIVQWLYGQVFFISKYSKRKIGESAAAITFRALKSASELLLWTALSIIMAFCLVWMCMGILKGKTTEVSVSLYAITTDPWGYLKGLPAEW